MRIDNGAWGFSKCTCTTTSVNSYLVHREISCRSTWLQPDLQRVPGLRYDRLSSRSCYHMTVCHLNFKSVLWYKLFYWPVILSVHGSMSFCRGKYREAHEELGSLLACPHISTYFLYTFHHILPLFTTPLPILPMQLYKNRHFYYIWQRALPINRIEGIHTFRTLWYN